MSYSFYQSSQSRGLNKLVLIASAALAALLMAAFMIGSAHAQATGTYSLFGSATQGTDGVHLFSSVAQPYSGVNLGVDAGTTVSSLSSLALDFSVLAGNCGGGSLRYQVETAAGNIFVYVGDTPNFTNCNSGPTGNLLSGSDLRVDTTQVGGSFYDTWAHAVTLTGSQQVTGLSVVADGYWAGADQEFVLTSATIDGTTVDLVTPVAPTTKDQCKNGGWMNFQTHYKNQGQCVASVVANDNASFKRQ